MSDETRKTYSVVGTSDCDVKNSNVAGVIGRDQVNQNFHCNGGIECEVKKCILICMTLFLGCAGVAYAVWGSTKLNRLSEVTLIFAGAYRRVYTGILFSSVFVVLVAGIGISAVCWNHQKLLKLLMVLLIVMLLVEIGLAVAGFVYQNQLKDGLAKYLKKGQKKIKTPRGRKGWEFLHQEVKILGFRHPDNNRKLPHPCFQCCGVTNYTDWEVQLQRPPESCCKDMRSAECESRTFTNVFPIYTDSCIDDIRDWLIGPIFNYIGIPVTFIALIQTLVIITACCYLRDKSLNDQAPLTV